MNTIKGTTRIELGDTVRERGTSNLGTVTYMRYAGLRIDWFDHEYPGQRWQGYGAVELVST